MKADLVSALNSGDLGYLALGVNASNVNDIDRDMRTLLHHAVLLNNAAAIQLLIEKKADLDVSDYLGWSPLHYASQKHYLEVAKLLIKAGVKINSIDNYGNNILWRAVFESKGRGDMINLLLSHGADPNQQNNKGISPLKLANTISNYNIKKFFEK